MTTSLLAAWITAGFLVQVVLLAATWLWRRSSRPAVQQVPLAIETRLAWEGWREFRVADRGYEDAARTSCSFYLVPVDGRSLPPFKPGQFLTFSIPIEGAPALVRCYSLSEVPRPDRYRITVKRVAAPRESPELPPGACSNLFHDRLRIGDLLQVKAPNGRFVLDDAYSGPIAFVAGGIGITPLLCMLGAALATRPDRPTYLFYGVRNSGEQAFKKELEALAAAHPSFRLVVAYSRPGGNDRIGTDYQHEGHVDIDLLRRELPYGGVQFHVCGPPGLMASLLPALLAWGVPNHDIHFEAFGPASAPAEGEGIATGAAGSFKVRWNRSGRTLAWTGTDANLLAFAERQNIAVESGCRSGSCGTCETRIESGTVVYSSQPDYAVRPGHCLLCISRPRSDVALEA